jgi:tRNA pseudouridine32 synthase/23S rRNA pseudouridine746 synthase
MTDSGSDQRRLFELVLFIDAEAIVVDKPAGLPVDRPRVAAESVMDQLDEMKFGFHRPPAPVHRLDRDTSGCLLLARNPKARASFGAAFETGQVEKTYVAVIDAVVEGEGMITLPLAKTSSREQGWRMVADDAGKRAVTRWRALRSDGARTLVEFRPETGRTHQIRAHALYGLNAPIVGDPTYGQSADLPPSTGSGQAMLLHAVRLVVPRQKHPAIDVTAPLPERFGSWRSFDELGTENEA